MKHLLTLIMFIGSTAGADEADFEAYFEQNSKSAALNMSVDIEEAFAAAKVYKCADDPKVGPLTGKPFRSSQRQTSISSRKLTPISLKSPK